MKKKLDAYLPPVLLCTYEFPLLCSTEQVEADTLERELDTVLNAQFIITAPLRGIERYEHILKIVPQQTDTLDERRFRIMSKMNAQLPFSMRKMQQQLTTLCGVDGFKIDMRFNTYILDVKVALTAKRNLNAVRLLLQDMVPANIEQHCSLLYNQHSTVARFTHQQLASRTYDHIRNEVL